MHDNSTTCMSCQAANTAGYPCPYLVSSGQLAQLNVNIAASGPSPVALNGLPPYGQAGSISTVPNSPATIPNISATLTVPAAAAAELFEQLLEQPTTVDYPEELEAIQDELLRRLRPAYPRFETAGVDVRGKVAIIRAIDCEDFGHDRMQHMVELATTAMDKAGALAAIVTVLDVEVSTLDPKVLAQAVYRAGKTCHEYEQTFQHAHHPVMVCWCGEPRDAGFHTM